MRMISVRGAATSSEWADNGASPTWSVRRPVGRALPAASTTSADDCWHTGPKNRRGVRMLGLEGRDYLRQVTEERWIDKSGTYTEVDGCSAPRSL